MAVAPKQEPYVYQPYPKTIFHVDGRSKVVKDPDQHAEHSDDEWKEEPWSAAPDLASKSAPVEGSFCDLSAKDAQALIDASDLAIAKGLLDAELANPNKEGGRKGVLKAIQARIDALTPQA